MFACFARLETHDLYQWYRLIVSFLALPLCQGGWTGHKCVIKTATYYQTIPKSAIALLDDALL